MKKSIAAVLLSGLILVAGLIVNAEARGGYAGWVRHGDVYRVKGRFGQYRQTFTVEVQWRRGRFVLLTPIGTFPLRRAGGSVVIRARLNNAWAHATWSRTRATLRYKGDRGYATVRRIGRGGRGGHSTRRARRQRMIEDR